MVLTRQYRHAILLPLPSHTTVSRRSRSMSFTRKTAVHRHRCRGELATEGALDAIEQDPRRDGNVLDAIKQDPRCDGERPPHRRGRSLPATGSMLDTTKQDPRRQWEDPRRR